MHVTIAKALNNKLLPIFESKRYDLIFSSGAVLATLIWNFFVGRDLNWDQANYHLYLPYSLFDHRIDKDFIPTSGQSYLNPLAYVPFYLMVMSGWPSLLIGSILAALHATNIILVYHITKSLLCNKPHEKRVLATLGAAFAFTAPVFLMEIGTSFADISTTTFTLAAVLLIIQSDGATQARILRLAVAGVLAGFASGLKLSNLVFLPALVVLCLSLQQGAKNWFVACLVFGAGFLAGLIAAHGYWGYQLWQEFGNPFLPFFSNFFPSDVFPKSAASERFMITSLSQALALPFKMAMLRSYVYMENVAPDLRYIALILITIIALGKLILKYAQDTFRKTVYVRRTASLFACFLLSFALWLWTSANGRYGLTVSLLCAPLVVATMSLVTGRVRHTVVSLGAVLLIHSIHLSEGDLVWDRGPWTKTWYEAKIPERLRTDPFLYITANGNSLSFLYPFLAKDSTFTNPIGQISFDFDQKGGARLKNLLAQHRGKIRVLSIASQNRLDEQILKSWVEKMDITISRLGFGVDGSDCESIITSGAENKLVIQQQTSSQSAEKGTLDSTMRRLITCRLYERPFEYSEERARITRIAENVVRHCSHLFKPAYTVIERSKGGWYANYPGTESTLAFDDQKVVGVFARSSAQFYLGTQDQWENGQPPSCKDIPRRPADVYNFY